MVCEHVLQHWLLQKKSIATQSNIDSGRTSGSRLTEGRDSVAGPSWWQHMGGDCTDGAISNLNLFMSWWPMRLWTLQQPKKQHIHIHTKRIPDRYLVERWLPSYSSQKEMVIWGVTVAAKKTTVSNIFFSLGTRTRCLLSGPCNLAYRVWDLPARYRKMLSPFQHFPWYESPIPVLRRLPCSQRTARPADTPSNIY